MDTFNEWVTIFMSVYDLIIINVVGGITLFFVDFKIILGLNQTKFIVLLVLNKKIVHVLK